jgi:hypothetical protein
MDAQKDLEAFRKAVEDVSGQINTIIFFRSALMIILTVLLIRALVVWNSGTVQDDIAKAKSMAQVGRFTAPRLDPISLLFEPNQVPSSATLSTAAADLFNASVTRIRDQYWTIFGVGVSLLGTQLQFDLRLILLALPLFGPLANVYLASLKYKRHHLIALAQQSLNDAGDSALRIDRAMFHGEGVAWILRHPAAIMNTAFWAAAATLVVTCVVFEANQATADDRDVGLILMNVTIAAFLGAMHWGRNIEGRMAREVKQQANLDVPRNAFNRRVTAFRERILRLAAGVWPVRTTALGSVLILVTLGLGIGQSGCDHDPEKGYWVVMGSRPPSANGSDRVQVTYAADFTFPVSDYVGWQLAQVAYVGVLALAAMIPAAMWWKGRSAQGASRLAVVAAMFYLLLLPLHASTFFLPVGAWMVYWLVATGRLLYLARRVRQGQATIAECESTMLTASEPLVVPIVCVLAVSGAKYSGLATMTAGIILLTAGVYAGVVRATDKEERGVGYPRKAQTATAARL